MRHSASGAKKELEHALFQCASAALVDARSITRAPADKRRHGPVKSAELEKRERAKLFHREWEEEEDSLASLSATSRAVKTSLQTELGQSEFQ